MNDDQSVPRDPLSEQDWARMVWPPKPAATEQALLADYDKGLHARDALSAVGATILFLTIAPPIAIILWRIAVMPWLLP